MRTPTLPDDEQVRDGLRRIRAELDVPDAFPRAVLDEASQVARRQPSTDHVDRTDVEFVTPERPHVEAWIGMRLAHERVAEHAAAAGHENGDSGRHGHPTLLARIASR